MTELTRLLESSDDELELALLKSAREDAPREAGLQDTALALGLTAATAKALADSLAASQALGHAHVASAGGALGSSGASAAASVGGTSVATLAKFLAAGALVSFGAMTTIDRAVSPASDTVKPVSTAAPRAAAPTPRAAPIASPPSPPPVGALAELEPARDPQTEAGSRKAAHVKREQAPVPESGAAPDSAPALAAPAPAASTAASAAAPSNASLAAEIRLLDRTRSALEAGDATAARRALRAYDESRPSAVLRHEANLLRVRLLLAEGDRRAAAAMARQIIAQHPESHHGDSLRSLAAEP